MNILRVGRAKATHFGLAVLLVCSFFSTKAQNADIDLLRKINNADISSSTFQSLHFVTNTTTVFCISVPAALLTSGLVQSNRTMTLKAVYMMESMLISQTITTIAKHSYDRQRPFLKYPFIVQK